MTMPPGRRYWFGPFRLDADGRVLYRDGQAVALTPKAIDVLIALVSASGQPVGKDKLLETVWAGTVVEEGTLASHVSLLRKAIGDGLIETLPKRGYRFVGQLADEPLPAGAPAERAVLAVLPFEGRGDAGAHGEFGEGLTDEVITQLAGVAATRWRVIARASAIGDATHHLEGSIRRAGSRVRVGVRLLRLSDGSHLWAESYERGLQDVLALQAELAQAITREVKSRLAPLRTLTFLFAASEDAAATTEAPGATALAAAVARHDALVREAIARHGGNAFRGIEGALCAAYADANAALLTAVAIQRALCTADEPAIRMRLGLHSGAVAEGDDEALAGPTLARVARVAAAAQGGQILVTAATLALVERHPPPGTEWRDLGDHTLRGFARPERLYQLSVAGLRSEFLPIRTQEALRSNLPPSLTMFVGRQRDLKQIREQMQRSRIVTLVGAGGTGKTRLSLEVARALAADFADGTWFVELAPLTDAMLVAGAIAAALGARAEGDTPPMTLIESALRGRRVLLLLDNCEHVVDAAAKAAQALLLALPGLRLLVTSRQALGIEGEALYRVPSLTLPGPAESPTPADVIASEAAQLFIDRALAVQPTFALTERNAAAVAQVCRQLDGIPLALELAAARLTALSVAEIARRLDDRFRLLTGGLRTALPRQRTLRALVDWSYELLAPGERMVLDALAVFSGSFTLDAAESVAAGAAEAATPVLDAIELLVAKSLLIAETHDGAQTRYRLLETIKQYAVEKLADSGLTDAARTRHFTCFSALAEAGAKALDGPLALEWLDRLDAEHDNLRAALDWAGDTDALAHARLAAALQTFWDTRGYYTEGWARLGRALALYTARDAVRLDALLGAGLAAFRLAYAQRTDDILSEAIALAQELGDAGSEAMATFWSASSRWPRSVDAIEPLLRRALALAEEGGNRRYVALTLIDLGRVEMARGRFAEAQSLFLQSVGLCQAAGSVIDTPTALHHAGQCALEQLDFVAARRLLSDALVQHRRVGNAHDAAQTLGLLGRLALNERRLDEAHAHSAESLRIFRALHDPKCTAHTGVIHAHVLAAMGDGEAALAQAESSVAIYRELDFPLRLARSLCALGCIHATLGQRDAARRALFSGLIEQQRASNDTPLPELLEAIAALHPGAPAAPQLLGSAAVLRERSNLPLPPAERAEHERRHAEVQARHPDTTFDRAFAAGRAMTSGDAIQAALALQQRG
jgi:predicted ATPase/DNA-binding winged helix-turn-helix (wHTH) protein/class 3 adenylate cyclase